MMPFFRGQVVNRRGWIGDEEFKLGLSLCQGIPGGTLMQLAAFIGLGLRGVPGAVAACTGFALPATLLITGLGALYFRFSHLAPAKSLISGLIVVVLAVMAMAVADFRKRYAATARQTGIALAAAALFLSKVSPGVIIPLAALTGIFAFRGQDLPAPALPRSAGNGRGLALIAAVALLWLAAMRHFDPLMYDFCLTMAKVDLLAFGGYGAFPVMFHEVVEARAWMDENTFLAGMALAQITPGPILLASSFVGYYLRGVSGALAGAIWVFTPSFCILLAAAPVGAKLLGSALFRRALAGVLSTLGGMIFATALTLAWGLDWTVAKAALGLGACLALYRGVDPLWVVLAGAGAGLVLF